MLPRLSVFTLNYAATLSAHHRYPFGINYSAVLPQLQQACADEKALPHLSAVTSLSFEVSYCVTADPSSFLCNDKLGLLGACQTSCTGNGVDGKVAVASISLG